MTNYEKTARKLIELKDPQALEDALELCRALEKLDSYGVSGSDGSEFVFDDANFQMAHALARKIRTAANQLQKTGGGQRMLDLYFACHLFDAPYWFDSFCIYIERDREPKKKFYVPRRPQLLPCVEAMQDMEDGKLELLGISLAPGVGKSLTDDTPILTRNGWKNHGDLVVGDEVIGLDGKFKKVTHVHPKYMLDVMVEFTNGEKIQCHENHEWLFYDCSKQRETLRETKEYEKLNLDNGKPIGKRGHRYRFHVPERPIIAGEKKKLPLDPYTFGVWLGDGANKNPRISSPEMDYAIIQRIVENGLPVRWKTQHKETGVWYFDFDMRSSLQSMGMCHSKKNTPKYIPEMYLTASVEQRLQLLAGLLDTDGTLSGSKYIFSTTGEELRDSFLALVATFGWRTCVTRYEPKISSSGVHGRKAVYSIGFTPSIEIPCTLERKQNHNPRPQRSISVKSITRVEPKQGNCITVEGDGMYLAGKSLIPTHNTTLAEFFLAWEVGKHPELANLIGSHNNTFLNGVYGEMLRILDRGGEYRWGDVFPGLRVINTNARSMMIDIGRSRSDGKRFMSLEFSSIGSGNAGKVRASNLLYCDDLVDGIETAMSKDRLDKLWQMYYSDLRQRKIGDRCKELHIATRWSLYDVIGRLEREYSDDPKAKFIKCPVEDENGESLYNYPYGLGYTTKMLHDQRNIMDDATYRALFMQEPIEREGRLYDPEEMRRYSSLPEREPDAVLAICDTKEQGDDYAVMPIVNQYGQDYYVVAFVCYNGKVEVIEDLVVDALMKYKVQICQVESNRGGMIFAQNIANRIKSQGGGTNITTKWTQTNKETRIIVNAVWVKKHCLFKYEADYKADKEYRTAMNLLYAYSMAGKNKHDDAPDVMALLAEFCMTVVGTKVELFNRTW